MISYTHRFLLVIQSNTNDTSKIHTQIRRYQQMIQRFRQMHTVRPQWYLIHTTPRIPSYALFTDEMIQFAQEQQHRNLITLRNVGRILNIPKSQQFLVAGSVNMQAKRIAKQIAADKIIGLSKTQVKWQYALKTFSHWHHGWSHRIEHKVKGCLEFSWMKSLHHHQPLKKHP